LPAILGSYADRLTGSQVRVYESSSASGPHVWLTAEAPVNLNEPDGPKVEAPVHLTAGNGWRLAEQLMHLVINHYQGDDETDPLVPAETRERVARWLFLDAHGVAWRDTAALAWDRRDEAIDRGEVLAKADDLLAVIAGKDRSEVITSE